MADLQQALPTQFSGLGDMWDHAPALAYQTLGDQARMALQNNQSLQDAFKSQEDYKAQERPLTLQEIQSRTNHFNAQSGLLGAQTQETNLGNQLKQRTLDSSVNAVNVGNQAKAGQAQIEMVEQHGQRLGMAAALAASKTTPWEQVAAVKGVLGPDYMQEHPDFNRFLLQHASAGDLPDLLKQTSDGIFATTAKAREEQIKAQAQRDVANTHLEGTKYTANTQERINQANIDAGKFRKYSSEYELDKAMHGTLPQQLGAVQEMARKAAEAGRAEEVQYWTDRAAALQKLMVAVPAAGAATQNQVRIDPNGMLGTQPQPGPQTPPVVQPPMGPASAASAPQPAPGASGPQATQPGVVPSDLPPGTKALGNGVFVLPDGRRIRKTK